MNLRNILLAAVLAVLMAGCVVSPRPYPPGYPDQPVYPGQQYDEGYYDYRNTPSYEGYFYARIIFIGNVPYYVDDDRAIRPIPPRLYDHFRNYQYDRLGRPPVFSNDREVRDGYPVSRIIYLNGVPYHVGNDRKAQPVPERLQPHFRYNPPNQGNAPAGNRPQSPGQNPAQNPARQDNGRSNAPPGFIQNRGQDRSSDQTRDNRGPGNQDRGRVNQAPVDTGQRQGGGTPPSAFIRGGTPPAPGQPGQPLRQGQPNAGDSHPGFVNGKALDLKGNRPQAAEAAKKKTDEKNADRNKSRGGGKDNAKKPGQEKDDDHGANDRGNGSR
ncbi:MAG: hypothetical protein WBM09_04300 [Gallionella sp.]